MQFEEGYLHTDDGLRLYFQKLGSGPEVILPNGLYLFEDFKYLADHHTLIFYDVRNRGRSDAVTDASKLARGVVQDADDLDTVRRYFGIAKADLIGHSYMGLMLGVHAEKYPDHVNRAVQIGPMQPNASTKYPAHLTGADAVLSSVLAQLSEFQKQPRSPDPQQACEKFWSILRPLYVVDPADAEKINWGRCELPNERNALKYLRQHSSLPSGPPLFYSRACPYNCPNHDHPRYPRPQFALRRRNRLGNVFPQCAPDNRTKRRPRTLDRGSRPGLRFDQHLPRRQVARGVTTHNQGQRSARRLCSRLAKSESTGGKPGQTEISLAPDTSAVNESEKPPSVPRFAQD